MLRFQFFSSKLLDQDDYIMQFIPLPFACFNNNLWNSSGKISSGQIYLYDPYTKTNLILEIESQF